jgi:cytochrome P450
MDYADFAGSEPGPLLARFRGEAPVVRLTSSDPDMTGFLVTRREDVRQAAMDVATFSSVGNPQGRRFGAFNDEAAAIYRAKGLAPEPVLVWIDPPEHQRFRKIVDRVFTAKRVAARSEHIRLCIDKTMAAFAAGDRIEAMSAYALKLPAMVMTREFGAPEDEYAVLIETTNAFGASVDFTRTPPEGVREVVAAAAHAATAFQDYMVPKIERVRRQPEDTMLSELANARRDGEYALTLRELQSLLITFLIAATHSTTGAIGWALFMLASRPDVQQRLRDAPDRIDAFNEEVLRVHGTVSTSYRIATRDVEIAGVAIPAGSCVLLRWDSANFDAEYWRQPEAFDIDRPDLAGHATFGYGPHFCVGNTLARREMLLTVRAFLERFDRITIDADAPAPQIFPSTNVHLLSNLPLLLESQDRRQNREKAV